MTTDPLVALLAVTDPALPWQVWNEVPLPDGMTIYDPDGFRDGKATTVTWGDFLHARMACTLVPRKEQHGAALAAAPPAIERGLPDGPDLVFSTSPAPEGIDTDCMFVASPDRISVHITRRAINAQAGETKP